MADKSLIKFVKKVDKYQKIILAVFLIIFLTFIVYSSVFQGAVLEHEYIITQLSIIVVLFIFIAVFSISVIIIMAVKHFTGIE